MNCGVPLFRSDLRRFAFSSVDFSTSAKAGCVERTLNVSEAASPKIDRGAICLAAVLSGVHGMTEAAPGDLLVEKYDPEKDSAAVTLTCDSAGVSAVTTGKFRRDSYRNKRLGKGVVFDWAYTRQTSVFGH